MPKTGPRTDSEATTSTAAVPEVSPAADEATTMKAWEDFLAGLDSGPPPVRSLVVSSWARSLAGGVDALGKGSARIHDDEAMNRLRDRRRDLLEAASQTLAEATGLFTGTGSMMLLTDADGVILDTVGDRRTIDAGEDIRLVRGGDWNEAQVGTNGIGTALATRQPMLVHAAEHFQQGVKWWTCAGAPIRDPADGNVVGLLDISGPKETFQKHNLALAVVAARQVEWALTQRLHRDRLRMLEACMTQLPGWLEEGVIALDRKGRIVHMSERAGKLLDYWSIPSDLLREGRLRTCGDLDAADLEASLPPELPADWVKPLEVDGERLGALVVIPSRSKVRGGRSVSQSDRRMVPHEGDPARNGFHAIKGASPAIRDALDRARRLASAPTPVLIEGETGVGKELFARAIHGGRGGGEGKAPYVAFNCGAVSRDLVASELFGYVRGAFTGAASEGRAGRFELADGGTLCLDEIGELPLDLQPYLLRVLEEGVVYRVGDATPRPVRVRLVALTNRNLREEARAGRFRLDLYYRIGVTSLRIPPLRERAGDLDLLLDHFNRELATKHGLPPRRFGPEVLDALRRYAWPGNVRELRNLVESLLLMSRDETVTLDDVPPEIVESVWTPAELATRPAQAAEVAVPAGTPGPVNGSGVRLEDAERVAIRSAIEAHGGNMTSAARALGISRSTLYRKLSVYGLERG